MVVGMIELDLPWYSGNFSNTATRVTLLELPVSGFTICQRQSVGYESATTQYTEPTGTRSAFEKAALYLIASRGRSAVFPCCLRAVYNPTIDQPLPGL